MGLVYLATNLKSGKSYIGLTSKTLEYRKQTHYISANYAHKRGNTQQHFHNALLKYDESTWQWMILEDSIVDINVLRQREIYWIALYKSLGARLYNQTSGGDGQSKGYIPTEASRLKQAKSYTLLSPDGVITDVPNMRAFCRLHGLSSGTMNELVHGRRKTAYGWRLL